MLGAVHVHLAHAGLFLLLQKESFTISFQSFTQEAPCFTVALCHSQHVVCPICVSQHERLSLSQQEVVHDGSLFTFSQRAGALSKSHSRSYFAQEPLCKVK